jgi:hypothetical protein
MLLVEHVVSWRWRCQNDGAVVLGSDLRIEGDPGTKLRQWGSSEVDPKKLRCPCGGVVIPLAPIDDS